MRSPKRASGRVSTIASRRRSAREMGHKIARHEPRTSCGRLPPQTHAKVFSAGLDCYWPPGPGGHLYLLVARGYRGLQIVSGSRATRSVPENSRSLLLASKTDIPTALRDVRSQGQSGNYMLKSSFSGFDPSETSAAHAVEASDDSISPINVLV